MALTIVYMVAGLSSRFGGKIKAFAEVGPKGETLIECSLDQAIKAGFTKIIFIVGNKTEKPFKEKFGDNYKGVPIAYVLQKYNPEKRDKPWGTCDAVCTLKGKINEPFLISNGDELYGEKSFQILVEHLEKEKTPATIGFDLMEMFPEKGTANRGIFALDENNTVKSINEIIGISKENFKEKGVEENSFCSVNVFVLTPNILEELDKILTKFKEEYKENRTAECLLPIELTRLIKGDKIKIKFYYSPEKWLGITNPEDELKVKEELTKQN